MESKEIFLQLSTSTLLSFYVSQIRKGLAIRCLSIRRVCFQGPIQMRGSDSLNNSLIM